MAWFTIDLTDDEQEIVNQERDTHPQEHVRRKMLVLWLLHSGLTRQQGRHHCPTRTRHAMSRPTNKARDCGSGMSLDPSVNSPTMPTPSANRSP